MRPLFPNPPPPPPMPRDPDRAVLVRRALQERLLETVHYLADEIEVRRVGGLGEARAAGYVAGRLQRAEQQATVISFRTGAGRMIAVIALMLLGAAGGLLPVFLPRPFAAGIALVWLVIVTALLWSEIEGFSLIGQLILRRASQSVVGVRAAVASNRQARFRVVLTAPLDNLPQLPPRTALLLVFEILALLLLVTGWLLMTMFLPARWLLGIGSLSLLAVTLAIAASHRQQGPRPAVLGAGELAVLIGVAEELGELQQVELWTVAVGGTSTGEAGMQRLLELYPFGVDTCFVNLHQMSAGQPVFVTREGLLREQRSDRRLIALAGRADADDVTINAEPRQLRQRTLAATALRRGYRAITISSHPEASTFTTPDPQTLERCVRLIVGMIRGLDREEAG